MTPSYKTLHKDFRLNGLSYSKEELKDLGHGFVKEGLEHEQAIGNFLLDWSDANETIGVDTSGSTGKPKRILLKKEYMVNSAIATGDFFDLNPGDKTLLCLPADFIAGKMMLVRAMVLGLELDCAEPSSDPLKSISKKYDFCAMVPLQVENSLKEIDHIKILIVGGAAISGTLKDKLRDISCEVFETYGMTETITHVALRKVNHGTASSNPSTALRTGSVENSFRALPDLVFSKDKRDCLVINASKISDGPIKTNDVVNLISETEFEWLGRHDNVINSGGIKLVPEQIEAKLARLISKPFFVAGLPDEKLGQKLVLIVEGVADKDVVFQNLTELHSLNKYEVPKEIIWLPKFILTQNGKIRRKENTNLI